MHKANHVHTYVEHHAASKNTVKKTTVGRISKSVVAMFEQSKPTQPTDYGSVIEHVKDSSRRGDGRDTSKSQHAVAKILQHTRQTKSIFSSKHRKRMLRRPYLISPKLQTLSKVSTTIDRL
jgi:hypothetical protein